MRSAVIKNYHISIIHPETRPDLALIFKEIALLLLHCFKDIGINCTLKINQIDKTRINIFLGAVNINYASIPRNIEYIPYQMEQLSAYEGWYKKMPGMHDFLQKAAEIWDYSTANIDFLRSKNIPAKYLPLGYHPALEILPHAEKDIDVLFCGSYSDRRNKIIEELKNRGISAVYSNGDFGTKRDQLFARAKIVLNIHFFNMAIFESARIHYLLNNKIFVITENSIDNPYPNVDLVSVPYEQLVDECVKRLADWENSQKLAELNYEQFKKYYPMVEFLRKVV